MDEQEEFPDYFSGIAEQLAYRPLLIVTKIRTYSPRHFRRAIKKLCKHFRTYSPRHFRRAIKKLCKHFGIPYNLTSLIAVAAMHDYELAVFGEFVFLFRVDSAFAEMSVYEPSILRSALEIETDPKVVQFI